MEGVVQFKLDGKADQLQVAPPRGQRATFRRGDIEVTLEGEVSEGGQATSSCIVVTRTTRQVSQEAYRLFEDNFVALLNPEQNEWVRLESGLSVVPPRFARWVLEPPEAVVAICEDVYAELSAEAGRLVRLLRWLTNQSAPAQPLGRPELMCSLDGDLWDTAPRRELEPPYLGGDEVELTEEWIEFVGEVWKAGEVTEPLARQILLEAVALVEENPRAALVLAVVAAEVGVKQFAAGRSDSPSEAWLITEIQSPTLLDLLRYYLPFFTEKRTTDGRAVPKSLITEIHEAGKARNDIVHQGESGEPFDTEQLGRVIVAVNDLLYLLDWFAGNRWAFGHLQRETQAAYADPEAPPS